MKYYVATAGVIMLVINMLSYPRSPSILPCCHVNSTRCEWEDSIPTCEANNLISIIEWIDDVSQVPWSLTAGTLLGSVRGGGHIRHETDIDIDVHEVFYNDFIERIIIKAMSTHYDIEVGETLSRVYFSKSNKIHVDIWKTFSDNDFNTVGIAAVNGKYVHYKMSNYITLPILRKCKYGRRRFPCYWDSKEWCRLRYGDDWYIPLAKYGKNAKYKDGDGMLFEIIPK